MKPTALAALALLAAACSDDASTPIDAAPVDAADAPIDAVDAAGCGADLFFTGQYLQWDSSPTSFAGIPFATWTVRGQPTRTVMSNPNGRVELCLPRTSVSLIDITKTDYVSAVFVADPVVFEPAGTYFSSKNFTTVRAQSFYASLAGGLTFDASKGHLLVEKQGTAIPLTSSLGGTPFAADSVDDTSWTAGNTGGLVLFANIDLGAATQTTLGSTSAFIGPTTVPLAAGTLTLVTIR
jgi:hypothetical protein